MRVLITGAGRGIGADAAQRLVARGARVALVDIDAATVGRTASRLGEHALPLVADVTDAAAMQAVTADAAEAFGGLDVVVANAGVAPRPASVRAGDPRDFERTIEINLLGVYRTVHAALPYVSHKDGYVLVIASIAASVPVPLAASYAASKAGAENFARSLRMELRHTGARVGIGYFGFIDTDMVKTAFEDPLAAAARGGIPGPLRRAVPVGHAGSAVARGVIKRSRKVTAPRGVPALLALRGLSGPLEALAARHPRFKEAIVNEEQPVKLEVAA